MDANHDSRESFIAVAETPYWLDKWVDDNDPEAFDIYYPGEQYKYRIVELSHYNGTHSVRDTPHNATE